MADFSPYPLSPFPAVTKRHQESPDITVGEDKSTPVLSPMQVDTLGAREALTEQKIKQNEEAKKYADEVAKIQLDNAKREADALAKQEADRLAAQQSAQKDIDQWTGRLREAREKYEAAPPPALFADGDTWTNVLKGLALGLGAIATGGAAEANARLGGTGTGPNYVKDIINMDLARQREKIQKLSDSVVMAKTGLTEAKDARALMLAEVDARGALAFKRVGAITRANLAAQGLKQPEIDMHAANLGAKEEEQKYKENVAAMTLQKVDKHFTKQTEGDVTTTNVEDPNKIDKRPSAAQLELSSTDLFNKNGEKIGTASTPKHADALMRGNGAQGNRGAMVGYDEIRNSLLALKKDQDEFGIAATPEQIIRRNALVKDVVTKMKGPEGDALGVLAGPDMSVEIGKIGGNIATYLGAGSGEIDRLVKSLDDRVNSQLGGYGIKNPDVFRRQYLMELPADAQKNEAPPTMFIPRNQITEPTTRTQLTGGNSLPEIAKGAAVGSKDSPEDVNSEAPLPEDPDAPEIDDIQAPKSRGKVTAPRVSPVPAEKPTESGGGKYNEQQLRYINAVKTLPGLKNAAMMKRLGLTEEDFR